MTIGVQLSRALAAVAFVALAAPVMSSPAAAGSPLACGTYKLCAKQGVIIRDHRTGATQPGK